MYILKVTNNSTGAIEQSDFQTEQECQAHKVYLESIGYSFTEQKIQTDAAIVDISGIIVEPEKYETIPAPYSFSIEANPKAEKLAAIAALEAKVTPRRLREAILTGDHSFIDDIESKISDLRASL